MSRTTRTRLERIEARMKPSARGMVVLQAAADDPESEQAAIAEAKATGLALRATASS